jgi:excisionase family DNA binding protein
MHVHETGRSGASPDPAHVRSTEPHFTTLPQPLLLSVGETSRLLGVSTRTIWTLISSGRIPQPVRLGRSVKFRRSDIEAWVAAGCPVESTT